MAIVLSDVLGWWDFQEGSGSTSTDQIGTQNATLGSLASWTTGGPTNLPNGVNLPASGANSFVQVARNYTATSASFSTWVLMNNITSNQCIMGNGGLGGAGQGDIFMEASALNKIKGRARISGADATITSSSSVSTSTLYHIVYTVTNGAQTLYINGTSEGTTSNTTTLVSPATNNLIFGQRSQLNNTFLLNGKVFQGILFNRALTSTEVSDIYNAGAGKTYSQMFGGGGVNTTNFFAMM